MSDEELGPVESELRRKLRKLREEAFAYVQSLAERAERGVLPTVNPGYLRTVLEMASETEKYRGLLGAMNRAYVSLQNRKNDEIADLRRRLAEYE